MKTRKKYSEKRQAILDILRDTTEHPSAEQIFQSLKPRFPRLSLGTVYRNLQGFKREGSACSLAVVDGQERFDGNMLEHAHFICEKCGDIVDLNIPLPDDIGSSARLSGFQVTVRQLFLRGRCPKCADKTLTGAVCMAGRLEVGAEH